MEDLWFYESGVKRRAQKCVCKFCEKEFLQRKNGKKQYCSTECSALASKRTVQITCFNCGEKVERSRSKLGRSRHKYYFCSRKCKDFSQSLKGDCEIIRPDHYGSSNGSAAISAFFKENAHLGCKCGEMRRFVLVVHHMDGCRSNNAEENFEIVCANCHMMRHLKQVDGEWRYNPKVLTPRNRLDEFYHP